jgi:acetolactate synthase-1/2/3 large subunit
MNIQELATCVQYEIPVVVVIINNFYLGMVRQWQEFFYRKRYSHSALEIMPDFVKLADAFGAVGMTVKKPGELREALREAIALHRPVIVDVHVAREENVYPMVPAGAGLDEMLLA